MDLEGEIWSEIVPALRVPRAYQMKRCLNVVHFTRPPGVLVATARTGARIRHRIFVGWVLGWKFSTRMGIKLASQVEVQ
jgi:hypothetical protein